MFQKCPLCNGTGQESNQFISHNIVTNKIEVCDVCKGKKIISTVTGKPPADEQSKIKEKFPYPLTEKEVCQIIKKNEN